MKINYFILVFFALAILQSCSSDENTTYLGDTNTELIGEAELNIKHYQVTGNGLNQGLFALIKQSEEDEFYRFYDSVRDLEYEIGFDYILRADKYAYIEPPQDGPSNFYVLKDLVSKTSGSTTENFEIFLNYTYQGNTTNNFLRGDTQEGYSLLNRINIDCNSNCDLLELVVDEGESLYGIFTRNENNEYVLQEIDVRN